MKRCEICGYVWTKDKKTSGRRRCRCARSVNNMNDEEGVEELIREIKNEGFVRRYSDD